jgi:hypothetical protein
VHELQLTNVKFELGAKKIDYFNRGRNNVSKFGAIMDECRSHNSFFENSKVEVSRWQANKAAHTLAQEASNETPFYISILIINEKL